jgi:hypothetical protein
VKTNNSLLMIRGGRESLASAKNVTENKGITMPFRLFVAVLPMLISLFFSPVSATEVPELTLANVYQKGMPLDGYWVSEKLDGVRAYWTGERLSTPGPAEGVDRESRVTLYGACRSTTGQQP